MSWPSNPLVLLLFLPSPLGILGEVKNLRVHIFSVTFGVGESAGMPFLTLLLLGTTGNHFLKQVGGYVGNIFGHRTYGTGNPYRMVGPAEFGRWEGEQFLRSCRGA